MLSLILAYLENNNEVGAECQSLLEAREGARGILHRNLESGPHVCQCSQMSPSQCYKPQPLMPLVVEVVN